jgi:hypothetical protein
MKTTKTLETFIHLRKGDYVYRYVLVDRFKHTSKAHEGFNLKECRTGDEIWQQLTHPRKLRRKYIVKDDKE